MRLVQQRFHISQQPSSLLLFLPFTHSPPLTGSLLRRSLSTCPVAIYNCSFLHNERGRENKTGFTHERGQWSFFLAAMIKQKNTLLGNNSASSIKYQTSGFSRKEMKLSPLFSGASFPMNLWDSDQKIWFRFGSHIWLIENWHKEKNKLQGI